MSSNDPMANVLSMIQNYERTGKKELVTKDNSRIIRKILEIMNEHGYIGGYELMEDSKGDLLKISLLGHVNKTGVIKPRFSFKKEDFEKWEKRYLPAKDFGIIIVSTSQGIMTHHVAKEKGLGGRLISYCY